MNGPVASAGSTFILFRISGTNVPNRAAKTITVNKDTLSINEMLGCRYKSIEKRNNKTQQIRPFNNATLNSLIKRLYQLSIPKLFAAKPCTIMAEDCTPTFPPMAVINGIKKAKNGFFSISNNPII